MTKTKTVAVHCGVCGWEGRRHWDEMKGEPMDRPKCPKCKRRAVYYRPELEANIKSIRKFADGLAKARTKKQSKDEA